MASAGVPIHEVKAFMEHASIKTTEQYLQTGVDVRGLRVGSLDEYKEWDSLGTLCRPFFEAKGILVCAPTVSDVAPVAQLDRASDF